MSGWTGWSRRACGTTAWMLDRGRRGGRVEPRRCRCEQWVIRAFGRARLHRNVCGRCSLLRSPAFLQLCLQWLIARLRLVSSSKRVGISHIEFEHTNRACSCLLNHSFCESCFLSASKVGELPTYLQRIPKIEEWVNRIKVGCLQCRSV